MRSLVVVIAACGGAAKPAPAPAPKPAPASAPAPKPAPAMDDLIAAQVDFRIITVAELDRRVDRDHEAQLDAIADQLARGDARRRHRVTVLDAMIDEHLLLAAAKRDHVDASDGEVDRALAAVRAQNNLTESQLADAIRQSGMTLEQYRAELRDQLRIARYVNLAGTSTPVATRRSHVVAKLRAAAKITIAIEAPPAAPNAAQDLDASALVVKADIEAVLQRTLPDSTLEHQDRTPTHHMVHFRATHGSEQHDFAVRVWRTPAIDQTWKDTVTHFDKVQMTNQVGDASFETHNHDVVAHGFLDRKTSVVVLVICGNQICRSQKDVLALARLVHGRLDKLTTGP